MFFYLLHLSFITTLIEIHMLFQNNNPWIYVGINGLTITFSGKEQYINIYITYAGTDFDFLE